jgi:hypothetical protein
MTRNGRLGALLRVTLRLSIVVAAACGIWDAYVRYSAALDEQSANTWMRQTLECAAAASDGDLLRAKNEFGNINVHEAPFHCADRDYWIAMYEIRQAREGTMELPMLRRAFDWQFTATVAAAGFLVANLLGLTLAALLLVLRWVARPNSGDT